MKTALLALLLFTNLTLVTQGQSMPDAALLKKARAIHQRAIVVDLHSDTTQRLLDEKMDLGQRQTDGHMDIPRMKDGGLSAQFFSIWVEPKWAPGYLTRAMDQINAVYSNVERYPREIQMAYTAADIRRIHKQGRMAALMGLEGGHAIEDNLGALNMLYRLGIRYMTLTWANNNNWADASTEPPKHNGLTAFGKDVVRRMNDLGMMVDISHVSDKTFFDALAVTRAPLIASHSSAKQFANVPRNMTDDLIRAMGKNGGVIHINFHEGFLDQAYADAAAKTREQANREEAELAARFRNDPVALGREKRKLEARQEAALPRPGVSRLADHFDHVKKLIGADHVGLGSDFDGARMPKGMEGVDLLPNLTAELLRRGYTEAELLKILGGNTLRAMEQVEKAARR